MNAQLGDLTKVPVFLCLCRFNFTSTQDNVGLELSFPEGKYGMDCLLLGYHYYITSIYNTAVYLESSPCSHLYNVSKTAALTRCVLKCHQVPHNAQELHHWLCMAALSASSTTAESLHGLPAETGPDRPWLL